MFSWIKANPIVAGAIVLVAVALIAAFFGYLTSENKRHENQLINQGATVERSNQQSETINAVQDAKNAVEQPSSEQLNRVCGKYDRNCPQHP